MLVHLRRLIPSSTSAGSSNSKGKGERNWSALRWLEKAPRLEGGRRQCSGIAGAGKRGCRRIGAGRAAIMTRPTSIKKYLRPGEQFAGTVAPTDGAPGYHLILVPGEAERISWAGAMAWAAQRGACLPTLREQELLAAVMPQKFNARRRYWSCLSFTPASSHARGTQFKQGDQFIFHKSYRGNARAVRRVEITSTAKPLSLLSRRTQMPTSEKE